MKFLQRLFHWERKATVFEKAITVASALFGIFCVLWLIIASYGIGNTYLAQAHRAAHGGSASIWATVLFVLTAVWTRAVFSDRVRFKVNEIVAVIVILVLLVLGVNANTGFFAYVH